MDKDCVACVSCPDILATNNLVDIEQDNLDHCHDDELDWAGCANDHTKADQNTGTGKVSSDQTDDVDINERAVGVAIFVMDKLKSKF